MTEFKRIPPEQAQALREQGAVVVDVRDPQAFAAGHIAGATHLDNHSVANFIRNADLDASPDLDAHPQPDTPAHLDASSDPGPADPPAVVSIHPVLHVDGLVYHSLLLR